MRADDEPIPASRTFAPKARADGERLPVTIVTGFLGSGKTTLINHILTNRQGVRAAVLVNEVGDIGIDGDLIVAADGGVVELANGCICCSVNDDLVDTLVGILERADVLDHLIIETSGVSDPLPVALTVLRSEFRALLRLDTIVALADADQFSLARYDHEAALNQLRYADVVLINKCDLASPGQADAVADQIAELNPEARQIRACHGGVPLPLILDLKAGLRLDAVLQGEQPREPRDDEVHGLDADHPHHAHHADPFSSVSFESVEPLSLERFQDFLSSGRPPGLFRAKGFLHFTGTDRHYLFHLVGARFTLDVCEPSGAPTSRLVLIGRDLDADALRRRLGECIVRAPPGH
ncbi:CobW family GTP-binding protein [Chelatococcus reniformis]|uniref:GTP-binding protein n=1 Tax=Chelatococcus reniformis TaxID=1494448 RepID=A0A916UGJ0_9HYPH|nr:GTP-binding protein [Chelatococcus reniformis]GGC71328.1 GTP-binding protein [Chelatococcus reniformis]